MLFFFARFAGYNRFKRFRISISQHFMNTSTEKTTLSMDKESLSQEPFSQESLSETNGTASYTSAETESVPETPLQMDETKREMLQAFGEAYRGFGLSKQMGHIVALLLYSPQPLSLDEITEQLGMSKGPISQVTRRLNERNIIRKVWNPGSRKDYYEIQQEVFANAFRNFANLIHHNTEIAQDLSQKVSNAENNVVPDKDLLLKRLKEMETFYTLMEKHFSNFLEEWATTRPSLYAAPTENINKENIKKENVSENEMLGNRIIVNSYPSPSV
jgi:DNA-binding transcriptional regulator GbsR (MarR family)